MKEHVIPELLCYLKFVLQISVSNRIALDTSYLSHTEVGIFSSASARKSSASLRNFAASSEKKIILPSDLFLSSLAWFYEPGCNIHGYIDRTNVFDHCWPICMATARGHISNFIQKCKIKLFLRRCYTMINLLMIKRYFTRADIILITV